MDRGCGVQWRKPIRDPDAPREEDDDEWYSSDGVDCEIVTFGRYLECSGHYYIPRQFLRPATLDDLFKRHEEIRNSIFRRASRFSPRKMKSEELIEFMVEQSYISDEIWARELKLLTAGGEKSVFLCHASVDKPTVRKVCNDLTHAGHKVWMDEFEINVGDSIVDKINQATAKADALVIFMSNASTSSSWVQREWQSTLARRLSGQSVAILPALIEDCDAPALISDIKYADFRSSYRVGLESLLRGLSRLPQSPEAS